MTETAKRDFQVHYYEKEEGKDIWIVESHLSDDPHDITVTVEIDMSTMVILDAQIKFNKCPTQKCSLVEKKAKQLIGIKVDSHFSRNNMSIFMGPEGCPNIMMLLQICIPGIIYYYYPYKIRTGKMTQEEFWDIMQKEQRNACLAHTLIFENKPAQ